MAALQVGPLVADVEQDRVAATGGALQIGARAGLVLDRGAAGRRTRDVARLGVAGLAGPLGEQRGGREGRAVADLGQVGQRRGLLVARATGHAEDGVAQLRGLVDEGDHAGHGRELLALHPVVLDDRVVVEVQLPVLHVVVPQRGVVDVEDDRRLRRCLGVLGQVGVLVVEQLVDLGDVRRLLLVRDALAGGAVVGADGRLDRVDVRDRGARPWSRRWSRLASSRTSLVE